MITTDFTSIKALTHELSLDRATLRYHIKLGKLPAPTKVFSCLVYDKETADVVRQYFKNRKMWEPIQKGEM